jgi:1,4-dihydroxy-2-naphthoate octaprenyltransferase
VVVGTAVASAEGSFIAWRALAAMVVALTIQVGTNYANDYSDGVRGTDDARVGPVRLVASGLARPAEVRTAAFAAFAVAAVAGVVLAAAAGWILVIVGAACIAAGWFYTGGSRPYGYAGLGEVSVFVFFGLVATVGSAYVQTERVTGLAVLCAVPVGLLATSLLVVNNLRDIDGDAAAGKRTLAVRIGAPATRRLYALCVLLPFAASIAVAVARPWALLSFAALPLAQRCSRRVLAGDSGRALVEVLGATGRAQLIYGLGLAAGLVL